MDDGELLERLRRALSQTLNAVSPSIAVILRRDLPDAYYQGYVFSLVLRAFQNLGADVELRGTRGSPQPFTFRGGPGRIHSTHHNYGYVKCAYNGREVEVHVGVQFLGTSRVVHEIDVAIVDRDEAEKCRRDLRDPSSRYTRCAIECKLYSSNLGTHLIRTFTGLLDDTGDLFTSVFASNQRSDGIARFCAAKRSRPVFAEALVPTHPEAETRFVGHLATALAKGLR